MVQCLQGCCTAGGTCIKYKPLSDTCRDIRNSVVQEEVVRSDEGLSHSMQPILRTGSNRVLHGACFLYSCCEALLNFEGPLRAGSQCLLNVTLVLCSWCEG